jgi:hypothetical protein
MVRMDTGYTALRRRASRRIRGELILAQESDVA